MTRLHKSGARLAAAGTALLLAGGAALAARDARGPAGPDPAARIVSQDGGPSTPSERAATVDAGLRAVEDGERGAPRDRWDPAYVAQALGTDPAAHLDWVRTSTAWVPYRGVLRGPVGVLLDRQGNSLDRALLLADLMQRAGHEVRLAHAEMPEARARALLPTLMRARSAPAYAASVPARGWREELRLATGAYLEDSVRLVRAIEAGLDSAARMLDTLDARTATHAARLQRLLPVPAAPAADSASETALASLRDHWWVQRREGTRWLDLDVTGVVREADPANTISADPAALGAAAYHSVVVRLVTERVSGGLPMEQRALEREIRPSEQLGATVVLEIFPMGWQPSLMLAGTDPGRTFRTSALEEREWRAALIVGGRADQAVISVAGGAAGITDNPFGGLGRGIARAAEEGRDELSAAWIEYETRVPGAPPQVVRRQLFDLLGPAARGSKRPVRLELDDDRRLERSLALTRTTELLVLGSAIAPEYLLHLAAKAALANRNFLRAATPPAAATPIDEMEAFAEAIAPVPSELYTLAAVRMSAEPDAEVYLDRPNILSRHAFLAPRQGRVVALEGTDIVTNDVAVSPGAADPVAARRGQGVRDTNAEALLYPGARVLGSVAVQFGRSPGWIAITSPNDELPKSLSADVRQRMADDLAAGYALVVPSSVPPGTMPEMVGWWRIDPRTGQTLGVVGTGWGGTLAERMLKHAVLLGTVVVEAWTFAFLHCIGAIGEGPRVQTAARAASPLDWLATPAWAQEGETQRSICVWEGWRAALTAGLFYKASVVWGILAKQFKLWRMLRAVPPGEAMVPGGTPAGGAPPGGTPRPNPPPECPPGGGVPRGAAEEPPPTGAGPRSPTNEPGPQPAGRPQAEEGPGAPPAEPEAAPVPKSEPPEPPPSSGGRPRPFDESWGDMPPIDPAHYTEQANGWAAKAPDAERLLGAEEAAARQAVAQAEQAKQELAALEANPPAPHDYDALQRMSDLRMDINAAQGAQQSLARVRAMLDRIRALVTQYRRLASLSEALIRARLEARDASESFERLMRSGQADFAGNQYAQWRRAIERYEQALKEYAAAVREVGKVPSSPAPAIPGQNAGGTLPLPEPVPPPAGGGQQCNVASPPPGSPPPGSPPPSPAADAQRQLAEAQQNLEAAKRARDAVMRQMDDQLERMFAEEAAAAARGEQVPPQTAEHRALLAKKVDAMKRVARLEEQYRAAQLEARRLEQQAAGAAPPPIGGANAPPQLPMVVGLGGMNAP